MSLVATVSRRLGGFAPSLVTVVSCVMLPLAFHYTLPGLSVDEAAYDTAAREISNSGLSLYLWDHFQPASKLSVPLLEAFLYSLFGPYPLLGTLGLAAFVGVIPSLMTGTCRQYVFVNQADLAVWLVALSSPLLFWSPWMRREGITFFS